MKRLLRLSAVVGSAAIVIIVGVLALVEGRSAARAQVAVNQALQVTTLLHRVLARVTDAETGQRGFVITGADRYLEPFRGAATDALGDLVAARRMTAGDPVAQHHMDTLNVLAAAKFAELDSTIALRRSAGFEAARAYVETDRGKATMDSMRATIAAMEADQRQMLAVREQGAARARLTTAIVIAGGTALAACLALLLNGYLAAYAAEQETAAQELDERARLLQEQATELEIQNTQLQEQAVEMEQQTDQLQQQAVELEMANEALQESVTSTEHARHALTLERRFLRQVIDINPNFIFAKDREGRFTLVNKAVADAYGTTIDDLVGKTDADFNSDPVEVEHFRRIDLEVLRIGHPVLIPEERITDATRGVRWLQTVKCPIGDDQGRADQILGVSSDITDRKRIEEELRAESAERARLYAAEQAARADAEEARQRAEEARRHADAANQAKSAFLATMSHELRTPLNAIGGYAELIELGVRGPVTAAQYEDLIRIRRAGQYLLGLINDVLNFVQLESAQVRYTVRDLSVNAALHDAAALIEPQAQVKGVQFDRLPCDTGVIARADPDKTQQVLLNLLTNAVKFTSAGGRVTLCASPSTADEPAPEHVVRLIVSDTGVGIPRDKMEQIFEPFVQIGRELRNPVTGVGLGLAISRELARGMGGDLSVDSVVGLGSTFTLTLPAQERLGDGGILG